VIAGEVIDRPNQLIDKKRVGPHDRLSVDPLLLEPAPDLIDTPIERRLENLDERPSVSWRIRGPGNLFLQFADKRLAIENVSGLMNSLHVASQIFPSLYGTAEPTAFPLRGNFAI
jgi:hypothetical protein